MKVDDQMRNILAGSRLNSLTEKELNNKFKEGKLTTKLALALKDFTTYDKDTKTFKLKDYLLTDDDSVFDGWIEEIRGFMTYDPTKEVKLTEKMLTEPEYHKFAKLHSFVTKDLGMELGVDSAQKIYNIQGSLVAHSFNKSG